MSARMMIPSPFRSPVAAALILGGSIACAGAQSFPPPGVTLSARDQVCSRLEAQLSAADRGSNDPARAEQIRRYEDAANRQQSELDRTVAQSRRQGCEGSGFFQLFGGGAAPNNAARSTTRSRRCAAISTA